MQAKLTLSIEKEVIDLAKDFSRRQHKSLSKLVESYLRQISTGAGEKEIIPPRVARLSGVIKPEAAERRRAEYANFLSEKYR